MKDRKGLVLLNGRISPAQLYFDRSRQLNIFISSASQRLYPPSPTLPEKGPMETSISNPSGYSVQQSEKCRRLHYLVYLSLSLLRLIYFLYQFLFPTENLLFL